MEKIYQYREINTNEIIEDFMAEDYALKKLGLKIEPQGKNGELTVEQLEFKDLIIDWFFSGNWIKEELEEDEDEDYEDINNVKTDMLYDKYKDSLLGL